MLVLSSSRIIIILFFLGHADKTGNSKFVWKFILDWWHCPPMWRTFVTRLWPLHTCWFSRTVRLRAVVALGQILVISLLITVLLQWQCFSDEKKYKGWLTILPFSALWGKHGHVNRAGSTILDHQYWSRHRKHPVLPWNCQSPVLCNLLWHRHGRHWQQGIG